MGFANFYIEKYTQKQTLIKQKPHPNVRLIVTIPAYNEPNIIQSLQSLCNCQKPNFAVEIIVLVNCSENSNTAEKEYNFECYKQVEAFANKNNSTKFNIFALYIELPHKDAGVGLARKTAMDEAIQRFNSINQPLGIITGFDADSLCAPNYFTAIEQAFSNPKINGASIYFEHPVNGTSEIPECYKAIVLYELYLHYYNSALRFVGLPFAFHTIGSAFAVTAKAYIAQGGMNKRKAGEDFYFLHKIISLGNFIEINNTCVYPSPRISNRVPFGTGAAVNKIIIANDNEYLTFNPLAFIELKKTIHKLPSLIECKNYTEALNWLNTQHPTIAAFFVRNNFEKSFIDILNNSNKPETFTKRFYNWFNGLLVLQYLNEAHVSYFKKIPIVSASNILLNLMNIKNSSYNELKLLNIYRSC